MRLVGFNKMTEAFRTQIYELLEQSKVVHQIKDKEKRKVVAMTKDLKQILANNEKQNNSPFRVKKVGDKYKYDFVSYDKWDRIMTNEDENCEDDLLQGKFKHFKGCITTDGKDELGEDVWIKLTDSQKKKYYKKAQDLIIQIVDGFKEAVRYSDEYLYEDRHKEIVNMYNQDWVNRYDDENFTDIFSISIMLAQLVRYDGIIKETKDGIIPKVKVDLTEAQKKKTPLWNKKRRLE